MRRIHAVAGFLAVFIVALYWLSPAAPSYANLSIFSDDPCPNPLNPRSTREPPRKPICRSLETHPDLNGINALQVELCLSSKVPNHGWLRIERTDKAACAASEAIIASNDHETDELLKRKGPDIFHVRMDGEQRLALETDAEYLGQCTYRHPFRLATAAPFNLTILWAFENYRAALETEELSTQYDTARPVLADIHVMISSPTSAQCPPVGAVPTLPQWRSPALASFMNKLPPCSAFTPTQGFYLRPHHSEDPAQSFQRYLFQPAGCQWFNPLRFGAPSSETIKGFRERHVLFLGDSHARYAYDLLIDVYAAAWDAYLKALALKGLEKSEKFGKAVFDFVWEPVLMETRIQINCSVAARYDTVVLGAGQHNAIRIPKEKDHPHQYSMLEWEKLMAGLAHRLSPAACPGQKMPKVIWMGNPARIVRLEPAAPSEWVDGRSSLRVRHYDELAWEQFRHLPGAARVDMFALSQPFVNDFKDMLHMRHTDALAALIQDVHEKIRPTESAYQHLSEQHSLQLDQ
ncbi:hypothetical protein BKA62DRAFT_741994 [Auriculariales sp. MPI-PUGE-AT-0066]|nr:hypothetical protein BKA62DRAFT_741994 [Auriculariales sp. MPI-PUGE-AT-0066]